MHASVTCKFYIHILFTERTEELNYKPPPTIQTRTRFVKGPLDEFRGFAYHTTYNDGASSNVVFVTGPEARQIQNPETEKNTNTGDFTLQPRKLISELTSNENIPQFLKIDDFFKNPVSSIQNFYSRNEKAFTENLQTGSNYPASTVPLQNAAVDINTGIALKSTENSTEKIISTSETTSTTDSTTEKEVETAESVVNSNQLAAFLLQTSSPPSLNDAANNTEAIDSSTTADKLPSAKSEENVNENSVTLSESTTQHTTESGTISETTSTDTIEKLRQQKCLKELQSLKNK